MLDTLVKQKENELDLRDRVMTLTPTPRVERLRQRYLATPNKALTDIGRILTQSMKDTEGEPVISRRAKAFAAIVRGAPINIYADELFVGWLWSEPRGTEVPVGQFGLEKELDTLSTREYTPFQIDEKDKQVLREEIFPYWKARRHSPSVPPEAQKLGVRAASKIPVLFHYVVNYEKVLKKGLLGVKQDAEERLARLDLADPEDAKKAPFLEGVIVAMQASSEIGSRFAAEARALAKAEGDATRKAELLKMAEVCDRVPAHPASSFYEALQSVWFIHIMLGWEVGFHGGQSVGRADQYLYPFYENDLREGRLTQEQGQELIDCWFMRFSQMFSVMPAGQAFFMSNHTSAHHLGIGGLKADGNDASNALSYMFIEAMMHTPGMVEPTLGLLVHSKTPDDLLIKACKLTALGGGYPQFINHDVLVENLMGRGATVGGQPVSLETARQYGGCVGCHEPSLHTMESGWTAGQGLHLAAILESVLTNGWSPIHQRERGLKTGDPREFRSFEELKEAFLKQVAHEMLKGSIASNLGEEALIPTLFTSALTEDCIENATPREQGGARYNVGSCSMSGTPDVGNSLAAIKKLVFDEKTITMDQLCEALENNFEGYEDIHRMCMAAPKFGNDEDYVDELVAWVTHEVAQEAKKYKTTFGGTKYVVQVPLSSFIPLGMSVGALPSGRLAKAPISDGVSPTCGTDMQGPTGVLKSVGKINNAEVALGQTLNLKLDPVVFETDDGFKRLADLIRVFVDQKVDHLQINVVSSETLIAAQETPEDYRDLVVKVAGYNANFVDLHKELQDSIIARTVHGM